MLLEYDTTHAPLYPRDGLVISSTAIYRRVNGDPHLSFLRGQDHLALNGATYPLRVDNVAPIAEMNRRGRSVARSGFRNMIRPAEMRERSGIYLTEPYDPAKAVVLIVPGLQSTPFAFVDLLKTMRADPEVSASFQVWTFLYPTGMPVLFSALRLRQELDKTIHEVDPRGNDFATRNIVIVGHSMGGLLAHTLVSSSGNKLWSSVFALPPRQLKGAPHLVRQLRDALTFQRNPRVVRAIFLATPHRGSKLADSWIGRLGESLIRLPAESQRALVQLATNNPHAPTPAAAAFTEGFNFTSVHALSPKEPALRAEAELPIQVPFHSIIGQHEPGPVEAGSDGVVSYKSAHLSGAASELVVRSGHDVYDDLDAQREVIRILHLELNREGHEARLAARAKADHRTFSMLGSYAEERNRVFRRHQTVRESAL